MTQRAMVAATAASTAFPPRRSAAIPAAVASRWVVITTTRLPVTWFSMARHTISGWRLARPKFVLALPAPQRFPIDHVDRRGDRLRQRRALEGGLVGDDRQDRDFAVLFDGAGIGFFSRAGRVAGVAVDHDA